MTAIEVRKVADRSTGDIFASRFKGFGRENPNELELLKGDLLIWGSSIVASGLSRDETLGDMIASHIDYILVKREKEGRQTTVEEFVEEVFSKEANETITADEIMLRLQRG